MRNDQYDIEFDSIRLDGIRYNVMAHNYKIE